MKDMAWLVVFEPAPVRDDDVLHTGGGRPYLTVWRRRWCRELWEWVKRGCLPEFTSPRVWQCVRPAWVLLRIPCVREGDEWGVMHAGNFVSLRAWSEMPGKELEFCAWHVQYNDNPTTGVFRYDAERSIKVRLMNPPSAGVHHAPCLVIPEAGVTWDPWLDPCRNDFSHTVQFTTECLSFAPGAWLVHVV